jgi:predicted phosphoribosyltransferase
MAERLFRDRRDAGRVLAGLLDTYRGRPDVLVLGLPRGGVPVAYEVAMALGAPLDVFLVRKLGVPGREELAMGAIASGGVLVLNEDVVRGLGIAPEVVRRVAEQEGRELLRRERAYREGRPPSDLAGKTVILVDDGLATGASMRAAVQALRELKPARIVVAVPAAPDAPGDSARCVAPVRGTRHVGTSGPPGPGLVCPPSAAHAGTRQPAPARFTPEESVPGKGASAASERSAAERAVKRPESGGSSQWLTPDTDHLTPPWTRPITC